jgi:ribosomal protein S18 acetylase RimI-like enzyme
VRQETLRFGASWARLAPWRGDTHVAQLLVGPDAHPSEAAVRECLARARASGYQSMVTGALAAPDSEAFLLAGLEVHERLHLLVRELDEAPEPPPRPLARATPRDRRAIVALDDLAFSPFWQLGRAGIRDALDATPTSRVRIGRMPSVGVVAYAITGRAGLHGYLQRVAVHPDARRCGWGRALVADALVWLWEHGASRAFVNTQAANRDALDLYTTMGFELLPDGLCVLGCAL